MKKTNFMVILLGVLLLASIGYIVFDKCTRGEVKCRDCEKCDTKIVDNTSQDKPKEYNSTECKVTYTVDPKEKKEGNSFTDEERELKTCTVDMKGKTELTKKDICSEDFFVDNWHREVLINNITINGKTHTVRYYYDGLHADVDENIVKVYIDGYLSVIHKGTYQNALSKIKITKDGNLQLTEYSFTDVPATTNTYYIGK